MRQGSRARILIAPVVGVLLLAGAVTAGILWVRGPQEAPKNQAAASSAGKVLADIERYRNTSDLQPDVAVQSWFALFERAEGVARASMSHDIAALDPLTRMPVSERSMFAALPPPAAWPAFRAEALRRAQADNASTNALAVRFLAEVLMGDLGAANLTLDVLARDEKHVDTTAESHTILARLYGNASNQLAAFEAELDRTADEYEFLRIPDLVALAGDKRAEELLARAIGSGRLLQLDSGESTKRLARRVALANVTRMTRPQWSLACSVDAATLYQAMSRRFDKAVEDVDSWSYGWQRQEASQYYFLAMIIQGRQAEAERALEELQQGDESISIPKNVIEALQRAQMNEQLYGFLDSLLRRRPGMPAWNLYIEQAAYTGHGQQALARVESAMARKDLSPAQRFQLRSHRFRALLAADHIDQAEEAAREMLSLPIGTVDGGASQVGVASQAMSAGRLADRPALRQLGETYLRAVLEDSKSVASDAASSARHALYIELRGSGRSEEALALAKTNLARKVESFQEAVLRRMGQSSEGDQASLVEMASIHLEAGRHAEVLTILKDESYWGAGDIAGLMKIEDSQGLPLPVIVARTLAATGDEKTALRIARATTAELPGEDGAYELIAKLDPNAIQAFDAIFAVDEYEERPLIWKASVQLANGAADDAEATIRQAIAIDPSDGEEGPNDRMRAYAVLSSILEQQGDATDARLYANAVEAIRLSERGDRLHGAGLYQRAFATYRQALEKFSDAYCIQSRLAVQLNKQGRRQEALVHYRRAYELMPSSFGRVESHCFGCESVFEGPDAQSLAERVFTEILRKTPEKPQAHYLLAYLREHQGRYEDAIQPLRAAVSLDPRYLNAWKKLDGVAGHAYIDAGERDIVRLKMLELDPLARHVYHNLSEVGDLRGLWLGAQRSAEIREKLANAGDRIYPLEASARLLEEARTGVPEEMRAFNDIDFSELRAPSPNKVFADHVLVMNAAKFLGAGGFDAGEVGD